MNRNQRVKIKLRLWMGIPVILLIGAGLFAYSRLSNSRARANETPTLQTAVVRRGTLILSASGAGTLAPADEKDLSFAASGEVTGVFVKPGDQVKAGDLLAEMDSSAARRAYAEAKQKYEDLTSPAAIVAAQNAAAQAESDLNAARLQLEYLISPDVLYWETEVDQGKQDVKQARARVKASPHDQAAAQALTKAQDFLGFAQDKLNDAWDNYYKVYVPETFPVAVDADKDIYYTPTDLELSTARAAVSDAQTRLKESQELYNVLTGSPMPKKPDTDSLIALRQAKLDLENAQTGLDGTKITAPIAGTILQVNVSIGNKADTGTAISMADLSNLVLEAYLDESDYASFKVGNKANVIFDALPNQTFTGRVISVDPALSSSGGSSAVSGVISLDPTEANLIIGMSASAEVISEEADQALLVPVKALQQDASGGYSVSVMENGEPVRRSVEIGIQDLVNAEVKSGLNPGDVVLIGTGSSN